MDHPKVGGGWRHRRCGKCIYTRKERFVTLSILLLVQRRAMVRSKATGEYVPNLIFKSLVLLWITRKWRGEWRHRRFGKCIYTRKKRFATLSILLLVQRRAMARWKATDACALKSELKFFFACDSPESQGGEWRHRRCGKCIYTRKERFVTLSILLLVQRRAMARWKADSK